MLPLLSINHISRVCRDVDATRRFYRDVLGFVEIKRPDSFDFDGSWLFGYNVGIHLIAGEPVNKPRELNPRNDHLSFQCACLDAAESKLLEYNIPYVRDSVVENGIVVSQIFFHDPDFNVVEICNCDCLPVLPLGRTTSCAMAQCKSLGSPVGGMAPAATGAPKAVHDRRSESVTSTHSTEVMHW